MGQEADNLVRDLIAYIRGKVPTGLAPQHALVMQALDAWRFASSGRTRETLVDLMPTSKQTKSADMRRLQSACVLMKCALVKRETEWDGEAYIQRGAVDDLDNWYKMQMEDCYDAVSSYTDIARAKMAALKLHPLAFLRENRVLINGRSTAGLFTYGFYMERGIYKLDCVIPAFGRYQVKALNVPAALYATVKDTPGAIVGTKSSDHPEADMMLTTQFTGCCFCFSINGTEITAAHIDPGGGMGRVSPYVGQDVTNALGKGAGGFSNGNGGTFKAYGRVGDEGGYGYSQGAKQMTIVALKRKGTWKVYSQSLIGDAIHAEKIS